MDYRKFAGSTPRMLVLHSRYWLDEACARAAQTLDWQVRTAPVALEGVMPREKVAQLLETIVEFCPDFMLAVNLSGMDEDGVLTRLFEDLCLPYAVWFVDAPRTIIMGRPVYASAYTAAFTWDEAYCPYLASCGFPLVKKLPLAVDPSLFNAGPPSSWQHPPSFVGNSMTEPARYELDWINGIPKLDRAVRAALDAGRVTRERFGQALDAILDPTLVATLSPHERRHAEMALFTEGTRRLRESFVRALEPEGVQVCGDEHWRGICPRAAGPLNYEHDLPAFYRACEINLNITSIQMPTAVNQRVFDCPAAGGFLLTDAQPALNALFESGEMVSYNSLDECKDLLGWYRAHPEARGAIVKKARSRILAQHTYAHRLQQIEKTLREFLDE